MGYICIPKDAFWVDKHWSHVSKSYGQCISGLIVGKCIIIYMDKLTVFSKKREDHMPDLRKIFQRCRRYGISLNPKKCMFGVTEDKLLGHVILEKGISIDPDRIEAISKISMPTSKKELKSFFGKINFV